MSTVRQYSDSFVGLSWEDARSRLAGAQLTETEWHSGALGGPELDARFPDYELSVLFHNGKAVTTSFHVLTR